MKLAFNASEVHEAVSQFIVNNGFPIDLSTAVFETQDDGSVTVELMPQNTVEAPAPKPKAKRPAAKAAAKEKVEPAVMPEPEPEAVPEETIEEPAEELVEEPAEELVEDSPVPDIALEALDDDVVVTGKEEGGNDFSLFG